MLWQTATKNWHRRWKVGRHWAEKLWPKRRNGKISWSSKRSRNQAREKEENSFGMHTEWQTVSLSFLLLRLPVTAGIEKIGLPCVLIKYLCVRKRPCHRVQASGLLATGNSVQYGLHLTVRSKVNPHLGQENCHVPPPHSAANTKIQIVASELSTPQLQQKHPIDLMARRPEFWFDGWVFNDLSDSPAPC